MKKTNVNSPNPTTNWGKGQRGPCQQEAAHTTVKLLRSKERVLGSLSVRKREKMKRICFYKDKQMFLPALCPLLGPPVFQPEGAMAGSVSLFQRKALSENIAVKVGRSEVAENVRKCK